jgi:hypothetical protein
VKRLLLLIGFAIGYVAGSAAGRERYEQIRSLSLRVKDNPKVQATASAAAEKAKDAAPVVKDKVAEAAGTAASKVRSSGSEPDLDDSQSGYPVSGRSA